MARNASTSTSNAPSPMIPFFLLSAMVSMAILPRLSTYISALFSALQEIISAVYLWPLLIILGISLVSVFCNWMSPAPAATPGGRNLSRNQDWKGEAGGSDGSGVGLFIFLVFALVLIPWR